MIGDTSTIESSSRSTLNLNGLFLSEPSAMWWLMSDSMKWASCAVIVDVSTSSTTHLVPPSMLERPLTPSLKRNGE